VLAAASPAAFGGTSSPVAASSNIHVPEARIMFCVLATDYEALAKPDATHGGEH